MNPSQITSPICICIKVTLWIAAFVKKSSLFSLNNGID
jgi:hypothetical protein